MPPRGGTRRAFVGLVLLFCLLAWHCPQATAQTDGRGPGDGANASRNPGDSPAQTLCTSDRDVAPRILIGRFSLFGDFDPATQRLIEPVFTYGLVAGLFNRGVLISSISVWGAIEQRQSADIVLAIGDAFLETTSQTESGKRARENLATILRAGNCDFLLGGRIARTADVVRITPYLFDVEKKEIDVPFAAVDVSPQSIFKVPDQLSERLAGLFQKTEEEASRWKAVQAGCFRLVGPDRSRKDLEVLAAGLRRRILQDLANAKSRFQLSSEGSAVCGSQVSNPSGDVAAIISGEIQAGPETIEIRPVVKLIARGFRGRTQLVPIALQSISSPTSSALALLDEYSNVIASFLTAITTQDGAVPSPVLNTQPKTPEMLQALWTSSTAEKKFEQAALTAYQELSQRPDNAAAYAVLGNVFTEKLDRQRAAQNFAKSVEILENARSPDPVSPELRAQIYESAGIAQTRVSKHGDAVNSFTTARSIHLSRAQPEQARRTGRLLASALFAQGKGQPAIDALTNQEDFEKDWETLVLLGRFLALSGRYDDAEKRLEQALTLDPNNAEAKGLLADIFSFLGLRQLAAGEAAASRAQQHPAAVKSAAINYRDARAYFLRSLKYREDVIVLYRAGNAALELGNYQDAILDFEKVTRFPTEKSSLRWLRGAWLNLLESYLLQEDFETLEDRGEEALDAIGGLVDSRLVINYIRFVGRVLASGSKASDGLAKDPLLAELKRAPKTASAKKVGWDNRKISALIDAQPDLGDKARLLREATAQLRLD
jgi:tetratricopeptide (TPR) repeat protein